MGVAGRALRPIESYPPSFEVNALAWVPAAGLILCMLTGTGDWLDFAVSAESAQLGSINC